MTGGWRKWDGESDFFTDLGDHLYGRPAREGG